MSVSADLQKLVFDRLVADSGVHALVADRIHDRMPSDGDYPCVTFGASSYSDADSECITAREETLQLDCWTRAQGRLWPCRDLVDAVKAALHEFDAELDTHALVMMRVTLARVFADPDGITAHGVVQLTALIEER